MTIDFSSFCFYCGGFDVRIAEFHRTYAAECPACLARGPNANSYTEAMHLFNKSAAKTYIQAYRVVAILNQIHLPFAEKWPDMDQKELESRRKIAPVEVELIVSQLIKKAGL